MATTHHPGLAASGTENETGMQERGYSKSHNFGTSSKRDNKQEKLAAGAYIYLQQSSSSSSSSRQAGRQ